LTREKERQRLRAGYGDLESEQRLDVVRSTMKLIREVIVDRQLSWNHAQILINEKNIAELLPVPGAEESVHEDDVEDPAPDDLDTEEPPQQPSTSRPAQAPPL